MLNIKVINFRTVKSSKNLRGFFDVLVGDSSEEEFTLVLRGCALKERTSGPGYWWQPPAQKRIDKNTGKAVQQNGFDKYDPHFDITLSKSGTTYRPTAEGGAFKEAVLEQAVAALEAGGSSSSGGSSKSSGRSATSGARAKAAVPPLDDDEMPFDEDDDLPFR